MNCSLGSHKFSFTRFFTAKRLITIGLVAFCFLAYFSNVKALSVAVNQPSNGSSWVNGSTHSIDFNVVAPGLQTDFNESILASIYYSTIAGTRQNLIATQSPLFETINPDANSQNWTVIAGQNNPPLYTTNQQKDGAGAINAGFKATGVPTIEIVKYIPDTNLADLNANGGHISFWIKTTCAYCQGTDGGTGTGTSTGNSITLFPTDSGTNCSIDSWFKADANDTWKQIIFDLNNCSTTNTAYSTKKTGKILFSLATQNPAPRDFNYFIDGIRIYDNKDCAGTPNFDGNQEANTNCTYSWTVPDANNIYVDVNATDLNVDRGQPTSQASSALFNFLGFQSTIYNERSGEVLQPDSYSIDGNSWLTNCSAGTCVIPNSTGITGFHNLLIGKTGYLTRTFYLNINTQVQTILSLGMIPDDANAHSSAFQYYLTDGNTLATNHVVKVFDLNNNYLDGQYLTGALGNTTMVLDNNAQKYTIQLFQSNGTTFVADYNFLTATIKIPLDVENYAVITPFNIHFFGATNYDKNGSSADTNVFLYGNTINTATISDSAGIYAPQNYTIFVKGNNRVASLQPYLVKKTSALTVTFFSRDTATGISLPNTHIILKSTINGQLTNVGDAYTDVSGATTFNLIYNNNYYLDAAYQNLTILNQILQPITSQYTIRFNVTATVGQTTPISVTGINANFIPTDVLIDYNSDGLIQLGASVTSTQTNIVRVIFVLSQDSNILYNVDENNGGVPFKDYVIPIPIIDINSTTLTQGKNFDFNVFVQTTDGNVGYFWHTITFVHNSKLDVFSMLQALPANTDKTFMAFIALFATIIISGFVIYAGAGNAVSIVAGMCLLFFGFLSWMPIAISIIACIGGFAFYYLRSGF